MAEQSSTLAQQDRGRDDGPLALVVGLGASAGGIKALTQFFRHVPAGATNAAFVVIVHLSPDHDSQLAEVLQTATALPVARVTDRVEIQPEHVYVIPPNKSLGLEDGRLTLSEVTRLEQRRAPVDIFFRVLAEVHGPRAVAVVLSGTGPNGSSGLKRVKEHDGLTIAQDPTEAEHEDMPRNAIATGLVDYVLPVAAMPRAIAEYHERRRQTLDGVAAGGQVNGDPAALREVLAVLRMRTGQDFSNYKLGPVFRRIARRMNLRAVSTLPEYARLLRDQPEEPPVLMRELLISVTSFFRDPEAFAALERRVVPRLFEGRQLRDQVRVWVPGCATGEEAYSVAMVLAEHAALLPEEPLIQVFATDLDERAIVTAREGLYTASDVAELPEQRLQRFFQRQADGGYRVRRDLRELVLFARHNVIRDPPFSHLNLVACRNLLIYLNRAVQDRVLETFHFALRPGGYLFLGTSESPEGRNDLFATVDENAHLYEARVAASRPTLPAAEPALVAPLRAPVRAADARPSDTLFPADLHQRLLEQYAPPSIVVDEDHSVVHVSASAGRFLHVAPGAPSRDVFKLLRPELTADVRTALHEAARRRCSVGVPGTGEHGKRVTIVVRPALGEEEPPRGFFLVTIEEHDAPASADAGAVQVTQPPDSRERQLEGDLEQVRQHLRTTIQQYETQAEEAKAANEELQAMNEELRSAAEELETSKEELQSVNEELTTVNQELKIKLEELSLANNDFQNLINSTDIGTIFLDRSQRVKFFTPRAQDVINLLPTDVGRRLADISTRLLYERLQDDVAQVLERLQAIQHEVQTGEGQYYLMRLVPYRTTDDRIEGVVITFQDITTRVDAELRVRASEERLRLLNDSVSDYAIFTLNGDGRIEYWNTGAERLFGYSAGEIVGRHASVLFTAEDREAGHPAADLAQARAEGRIEGARWHVRKNGTRLYCSAVTTLLGEGRGFATIARDLTPQRDAELALRQAQAALEHRVLQRTTELEAEVQRRGDAQQHALQLLRKLVTAQEDERTRIARDLHDSLGQQLTGLRIMLERHRAQCTPGPGRDDLDRAVRLVQEMDTRLDVLAWELRPAVLDDLGLSAALPRFLREWSEHYGIAAEFRSAGFGSGQLTGEAEVVFYRVAQEALTNVAKHAHASRADVILESRDGLITLLIEDDGVGFDAAESEPRTRGVGLVGMRERAALIGARLHVESTPGKGTTVFLRAPSTGHEKRESAT